jgi:hypothetical protein
VRFGKPKIRNRQTRFRINKKLLKRIRSWFLNTSITASVPC